VERTVLVVTAPFPNVPGNPLWHVTLHRRQFSDTDYRTTLITELTGARSRLLTQQLNTPAQLQITLDGRSDEAKLIRELQTDLWLWRWDDLSGRYVPYFQGPITQAEDQITEQQYTINLTAHDYLAMLTRRYTTRTLNYLQQRQDAIAGGLVLEARQTVTTNGATSFVPGAYLPLGVNYVNGDGSIRNQNTSPLRDRTYVGSTDIGVALDDLANVQDGFDYDVVPGTRFSVAGSVNTGIVRIFYPSQGVARSTVLEYGSTLSDVVRTVNSTDYANFIRALGNNGSTDPGAPQLYSERWNDDSNNTSVVPVGLWMDAPNGAADINQQATLDQVAHGALDNQGTLEPSYTLGLAPGVYHEGFANMGDTMPVVIQAGRLNVDGTRVRIVGMTFSVGDDGQEDVGITVGRPLTSLADLLTDAQRALDALARR
jgi:hypothetical protein